MPVTIYTNPVAWWKSGHGRPTARAGEPSGLDLALYVCGTAIRSAMERAQWQFEVEDGSAAEGSFVSARPVFNPAFLAVHGERSHQFEFPSVATAACRQKSVDMNSYRSVRTLSNPVQSRPKMMRSPDLSQLPYGDPTMQNAQ